MGNPIGDGFDIIAIEVCGILPYLKYLWGWQREENKRAYGTKGQDRKLCSRKTTYFMICHWFHEILSYTQLLWKVNQTFTKLIKEKNNESQPK